MARSFWPVRRLLSSSSPYQNRSARPPNETPAAIPPHRPATRSTAMSTSTAKGERERSQSQAGEPADGAVDVTGAVAPFHNLVMQRGSNQRAHGQRAEEQGSD